MGTTTTFTMLLLLCVALVSHSQARAVTNKPNIIFFLIDDLGYNDIGYHDSTIMSPTIDALASEGMILENNYVAPVCGPSRAALLTGKLHWTLGAQHNTIWPQTPDCLTHKYPLLQEALRDQGYRNYILGKWHLGYCRHDCTPRARGFDEFRGYYNGNISHFGHMIDGGHDWRLNEEADTWTEGQYATTVLGNTAVDYINTHAANHTDKPLFMYFAFPTVHVPVEAPEETVKNFQDVDETRRNLKAMIKISDDVVHDVLDTLREQGMYDNTVIIFSSDNGGEAGYSRNKPLRGAKGTVWEGGVRVPGFIHSPLMTTSKGTVSKELFHQTDWYPTIVSMAGGKLHDALDGFDQTDFLLHGAESARDHVALHYDQYYPRYGRSAIRSGKWKLILGYPGPWNGYDSDATGLYPTVLADFLMKKPNTSLITSDHKYTKFTKAAIQKFTDEVDISILLFDLEADPTETTDRAANNPGVVQELKELLKWYTDKAVAVPHNFFIHDYYTSNPKNTDGFWTSGWCEGY